MTKTELVKRIRRKLRGATKDEIKAVLEATEEVIEEAIREHERVPLLSFLYVSGEVKAPRKMRNPYTGGTVDMPKRLMPKALFTNSFKKKIREDI